jgi:hypothetical protein
MYVVEKINKSIVITLDGEIVYSMPFWVQIKSREDMQLLADQFNAAGQRCIDAIMEFETKFSTVKHKSKPS